MEIKQLSAVVAVAETRSVTRAAELLHVVQPAVTRQIRLLEEELGVQLFERSRHGMLPTVAGEAMIAHARRVLQEIERAKAEIRPRALGIGGLVTVGFLASTTDLLVAPMLERLKEEYPGVRLRIRSGFSGDLQAALDRGEIDVALLYESQSAPVMNIQKLLTEQIWAVGPAGCGLSDMESVETGRLARHPLVLPSPGQGLRTLLNELCARQDTEILPAVETDSMAVQKRLVSGSGYWTVLPAGCLHEEFEDGSLEGAPVQEGELQRTIIMATSRDAQARAAVKVVADCLFSTAHFLIDSGLWLSAQKITK